MTNVLLNELNAFRANDGKAPLADWRQARHMPMLVAYRTAASVAEIESEHTTDEQVEEINEALADVPSPSQIEYVSETLEREEADVTPEQRALENEEIVTLADTKAGGMTVDAPKVKAATYKEIANYDRSTVLNPVKHIHATLDKWAAEAANGGEPMKSRKQAVTFFVEQGINYSTARTQYQRWFSNRKAPTNQGA